MVRNNIPQDSLPEGILNQGQSQIIEENPNNNSDNEDSRTQELLSIPNDQFVLGQMIQEEVKLNYIPPTRFDQNSYYDLESIKKFELDQTPFQFIPDVDFKNDLFWVENDYYFKWMDILCMIEKNLKAILLNKLQNPEEIPQFLTKKMIPFVNCVMSKLVLNESHLKIQTYCNEILLIIQKIALMYMKQYPIPCSMIIKKLFTNQNERMYDSRFQNQQLHSVIQDFYAERAYIGVSNQLQGVPRESSPLIQDEVEIEGVQYNTNIYYPIKDEILTEYKKSQSAFYFSPFLRIQIHAFYINNGFQILSDIINAPEWNIALIMEMLEISSCFNSLLNSQIYNGFLTGVHQSLLTIPEKISEEELKNSTKEQFITLLANLKKLLQPLYNKEDLDQKVGLIELQIILLCFRSQNLEKRIYGLQQFNDKINESLNNEYLAQSNLSQQYKSYEYKNVEWLIPQNILEFILTHKIFEDLFGDKSHIELIKRSFPLVRFLYQQGKLGNEGIINLLQIAGGKHEAWVNIMYKILNEIAEVLLEQDIEAVLNEIGKYCLEQIDQNVINFIKSFGKNPIFEKAEKKALKRYKKPNQKLMLQNKESHNNILDEMDLESAQVQPIRQQQSQFQQIDKEENISNLISKNKEEHLLIKIHTVGEETQSFEYDTSSELFYSFNLERHQGINHGMAEVKIFPANEDEVKTSRQPGVRKFGNSKVSPKNKIQLQDSGSEETNCDDQQLVEEQDSLGIRLSGRILLFLYDLLKRIGEQSELNGEIGKLIFSIFTHMLCNQFKFQRFNYLVMSMSALENAQWTLPPTIHLTIIQKVIQSNYPIINPIERSSLKTQAELTKWIEHQYNFKISGLGWIGRIKKQCVENLFSQDANYIKTEDQIQKIIMLYLDQAEQFLKFYHLFYSLSDGIKIEQNQIKLLWQILVENALNHQEQSIFFQWLHSILYPARTLNKPMIISQECIQLVFFEYLIKIHHSSYQTSMFFCLHDLVLHFNIFYKIFKPLNDHDSYMVMSNEIIGIEAVWHLFFESESSEISSKAQEFLLQIIKYRTYSQEIQNQLKEQYTTKIMQNIQQKLNQQQWCDQEQISISRSLELLTKMLEDLEGLKVFGKGNQEKGDKITVTVDNKIKGSLPPKKQDIILFTGMSVLSVKQLVGQRLNPQMKPEDFDIVNRGNWLSDNKILKDYKFENKLTIMIWEKPKSDDINKNDPDVIRAIGSIPIALPSAAMAQQQFGSNEDHLVIQNLEKVIPDLLDIEQKVQTICDFTGEEDKEFVNYILEDKKYNEADVIDELLDKDLKDKYLVKFQIKKSQTQAKQQQVWMKNDINEDPANQQSISILISEDLEHISTLFKVLQLNDPKIGHEVWQILSLIPRNRQIYQSVQKCLYEMPQQNMKKKSSYIEEEYNEMNWESILAQNNPHRLLYNIQILKELLECEVVEDLQQLEEVKHRKEGREAFILNGGLHNVVSILMNSKYLGSLDDEQLMKGEGKKDNIESDFSLHKIKVIGIAMEIFSIFSNAYILSKSESTQYQMEVYKLVQLNETLKEVYKSLEQQQSANYFLGGVLKSQAPEKSQKQSSSNSNSQTVSSLVTPNFQSIGTTPQNIPTPPNNQDDSYSMGNRSQPGKQENQSVLSQKNKIDEFGQLIQGFSQEKKLQLAYEDIYQTFVSNGDLIKHCIFVIRTLDQFKNEDVLEVLERSFSIILTSIYHQPSLINELYKVKEITDIFLNILLRSTNENLRRMIAFTIMTICDMVADQNKFILTANDDTDQIEIETHLSYQDEIFQTSTKLKLRDPRIFFLVAYIPLIESNSDFSKCNSEDLFVVIANLLSSLDENSLQNIVHFDKLFDKVSEFIIKRQIVEERFGDNEDKVLQGYLLLLTTILEIKPQFKSRMKDQNFVQHIYDFLFYMPSIEKIDSQQSKTELLQYPKCKRKLTRKRAFALLIETCKNQEDNFTELLNPIVRNHERFDHNEADSSSINVKGSHGYVGLKNLGCTCYINSLLQQIYMIPQLRKSVLQAQIAISSKDSFLNDHSTAVVEVLKKFMNPINDVYLFEDPYILETKPILQKLLIDHTLYQLQLVFSNLQESVKQYVNPTNFINSIKGYDGQQINVNIQQDVNEFFNLLTDKLETNFKATKNPQVLQKTLGGVLGHAIISLEEEFPYDRETDEPFLTVTIEIKNKKNLEEALDLFIKGDILEGENKYYCEQYGKKINVVKKCYFKDLPDTFVITLKRFEFDYNSMVKMKVNDYFEFPQEISFYKWTKDGYLNQGAPSLKDLYNLVGVLVHSGCAESGHYYSFIKDRSKDQWFEFNDKNVNPFNLTNLKNECFGGGNENLSNNLYEWDNNRSKSAYILFYQRANSDQEQIDEEDLVNEQCLVEKIWCENLIFLRNLMFYSADYLCFVKDFICQFKFPEQLEVKDIISYNEEMLLYTEVYQREDSILYFQETAAMKVIKLMTLFSYETLMKNNDVQGYVNSMQTIQTLYDKFIPGSFWLLGFCTQSKQLLVDLLFENSHVEVKNHFAKLLTSCISTVAKIEEQYLLDDIKVNSAQNQSIKKLYKKSSLIRFLKIFVDDLFPLSKKNMRRSAEYFQVLRFTSNHKINKKVMQSPKIVLLAQDSGWFKNFYNFFVDTLKENQSHFPLNFTKVNEKGLENSLVALFEIITKIIVGTVTQGMLQVNEDSPPYLFKPFNNNQVALPKIDRFIINQIVSYDNYKQFFVPMMQINNTVADVTRHLCWGDKDTSQKIIKQLMTLILDYFINWHQTDPIFSLVNSVVRLNDIYQQERIEMVFSTLKDTTLKANSIIQAIKIQMSYDVNYSLNCIKWIAEIGFHCTPFANYMILNQGIFQEMLQTLRGSKNYSGIGMASSPQILPNIINKAITQLEQILNIQRVEWTDKQVFELDGLIEGQPYRDNDNVDKSIDNFLNQGKIRYEFDQNGNQQEIDNRAQQYVQDDYKEILQGMEESDNESKKVNNSDESIRSENDFESQLTFNQVQDQESSQD